jgi:Tol biopolymer transport system component
MLLYRANHAGHALVNMHIQTSGGLALDRKNGRLLYTSGQLIQNLVRISVNGGASQAPERLTSTSGMDVLQRFSPDGKTIAFGSLRFSDSGIWTTGIQSTLSSGLASSRYATLAPGEWVPDGRSLAYFVTRPKGDRQVFRLAMEPARSHAC